MGTEGAEAAGSRQSAQEKLSIVQETRLADISTPTCFTSQRHQHMLKSCLILANVKNRQEKWEDAHPYLS